MKRNLSVIFFLISLNSIASDWTFNPDSSFRHSINFSSGYFIASNAINNRFIFGLFKGEFIDDNMKNAVSGKLTSQNRIGAESNTSLKYTSRNDTLFGLAHSFFSASISDHYHINSLFKKDFFELLFRGNKGFAGKTADLGSYELNEVFYQQVNFSFGHEYKWKMNTFEYSFGLSLNKGQQLFEVSAPKVNIFTEVNGEYMDIDEDITIHQSDSMKKSLTAWNGTGGSVDFSFKWKDKKNNVLSISAENFGFIQWNKNTTYIRSDTAFRFEGADVSYLFSLTDTNKKTISFDSTLVEPYLSAKEKKKYTAPVPALISISYRYIVLPKKLDIEAGINYLCYAGFLPQESLTVGYIYRNTQRLSLKASYGGYTGFNAGLAYKIFFLRHWMFGIQSDFLTGLIKPENGFAQGAFVSLSAYF